MLPLNLTPESQSSQSIERVAAAQRLSVIDIAHNMVEQSAAAKGIVYPETPTPRSAISSEISVERVDNVIPIRPQITELGSIRQADTNQLQADAARDLVDTAHAERDRQVQQGEIPHAA